EKPSNSGSLLIGDKGTLLSSHDYGEAYKLLPAENFEGYKEPEKYLPRHASEKKADHDNNQKEEWIAACKANRPELALANFDYAGLLTEAILLGNVAIRAGRKIEWDGPSLRVTNAPEAQQFVHREYRKG